MRTKKSQRARRHERRAQRKLLNTTAFYHNRVWCNNKITGCGKIHDMPACNFDDAFKRASSSIG